MSEMAAGGSQYDDPRKLRELLDKAASLASDHALTSVVVGLGGREGDLMFPELVDFVESALRVDDGVLFVGVRSSAWLMELRMMETEIRKKLNEGRDRGRVDRIRFVMSGDASPGK